MGPGPGIYYNSESVLEIEVEIFDLVFFFKDLIDFRTFSAYFRSLSVWARNGPSRKKDSQQLVCRAAQVPGGGFFPANHVSPFIDESLEDLNNHLECRYFHCKQRE